MQLNTSETDKVKISVTDILGKVVEVSPELKSNNGLIEYEINKAEKLARGIYIVSVQVNEKMISKKLVIQ